MKTKKKKIGKIIKIFLLILVVILLLFLTTKFFFIFKKFVRNMFLPQNIELQVDSIYSEKLKLSISNFVDLNLDRNLVLNDGIDDFCSHLRNNFEIIKDIEWNFGLHSLASLKIRGAKPLLKINNKFVLGDNKKLFDLEYFKEFDGVDLKNIYLAEGLLEGECASDAVFFLSNFESQLLKNYELNYLKPSYIAFITEHRDWNRKDFFIIDEKFVFDDQKIVAAEFINNKMKANSKWKRGYCFDLRFKDRIYAKPTGKTGLEFAQNMGRG